MLHTPQDAFQPPPNQSNMPGHRASQVPRGAIYPQTTTMSYRPAPAAPISPYAFQTTPPLRQDPRLGHQMATYKQVPSRPGVSFRAPYHDSSASSVSSTSSSSNRSIPGNRVASIDDSVLAVKNRQLLRDHRISTNMAASLSTPDLSLPSHDAVKSSPDRYHRISRRIETSPIQQFANETIRPVRPVSTPNGRIDQPAVFDRNSLVITRPPVGGRTGSFDDSLSPAPNSARYKRRSVINRVDSSQIIPPMAPVNVAPTWSQVVAGKHNFQGPLPPPQNPFARPAHHVRSSSLGEVQLRPAPKPAPRPAPVSVQFYSQSLVICVAEVGFIATERH
jgi:hypothetical protein